jgi:hypothetical protein
MRKHRNKVDPDLQNKQTNKHRYTDAPLRMGRCGCVCLLVPRSVPSWMGLFVCAFASAVIRVCVLAHVSTMRPDVASITATASTTVSPHSASTAARPLSGNGPKWESA